MTPDEWFSKPEFANELRKVLNSPAFRLALEVMRDFKAPDKLMLAKPDLLLAQNPAFYLGQIEGFNMFMGALYDLSGTQIIAREPVATYNAKPDDDRPVVPAKTNKRK